ncbi:dihydrodipicolinate synthase family protein [Edaphobacter albus]|uniref:dihydrodipicolinate synthase family protein n=1 Tax=Edaphobacter sp. 4G125 TaxID=2763071 RepID=UPI0016450A4E|nr:dihydrodipicolinate synthase family protein [Edaphobacter sp. 4G125]QNI36138.1 dihydrodipicolinate synthase family protein [Edaphobacter sp. 4G125]
MSKIRLPLDGQPTEYTLNPAGPLQADPCLPPTSRKVYAAAHVVIDPLKPETLDIEATLAFRRHLWSLGFGVAEAMDTAQRGMGLDWATAKELIRISASERTGEIACGANTDQLHPETLPSIDRILAAYEEQCEAIEAAGGRVILMASRALAKRATSPEDYARVYGHLLRNLKQPAILHWLGDAFDPQLKGYWGSASIDQAMETCLSIIRENSSHIDGIKISLLDKQQEIKMRRLLPQGVRMYTGDDFDYAELIRGDEQGHSDALLGIFDGIASAASLALRALDQGDLTTYEALLAPTVPLSRHIFQAPTYFYKTGLVFLAYLNGHQKHFRMLGGQESARSITHLAKLFVLADQARLLRNPDLALHRMKLLLELAGVEA